MSWEIRYRASVERDVDRLPAHIRVLVLRKIVDLGENPFPPGCKKLKGTPKQVTINTSRFVCNIPVKSVS
jgi:mRNA-degrading endonuclease RelE of RelBE toxin-antitoxin system